MRSRIAVGLVSGMLLVAAAGCSPAEPPTKSAVPSVSVAPSRPPSPASPRPGPDTSRATQPPTATLRPVRNRLTRQGFWWGVDSTIALSRASLDNVRDYYRTKADPVVWGRYLDGNFGAHPAELSFAAQHHIALYFLVPDLNCSGCADGDRCGNDRTVAQAVRNADQAIDAARRLRLPRGVALFKDIEQVGTCYGELTSDYLLAWYRQVRRSRYRPAFYGNSTAQHYDFPRAFCAAASQNPAFASGLVLAQDEPEPDIGAGPDTIGPRTAPAFRPKHPGCVTRAAIDIWQYGESLSGENDTDVDEIRPGTPGLLAPGGAVTG